MSALTTTVISTALSLALGTATAMEYAAETAQSHESILATAKDFLEAQLADTDARSEIRLGTLDARLRLAACDGPLEGFLPPGARLRGNTSVGVACAGSNPWKLYVQAHVAVYKTVAVAATYLPAGTALGTHNIRFEERDVTSAGYGYVSGLEQVNGKVVKQPVQEGRTIPPQALAKAKLIRRGESVVILSRSGHFEVRMSGSAMMDGAAGDRIKVRNEKSKRIIEGKVEAPGLVTVSM